MWEKIVLNLLSNAFKFTFAGRDRGAPARPRATRSQLTVRDTGTGIPAEELPRLFERFHRVEGAQRPDARGDAASASRWSRSWSSCTAAACGVESAVGAGSTFTVTIPLGIGAPAGRATGRRASVASAPRQHHRAYVEEASRWLPDVAGDGSSRRRRNPGAGGRRPADRPPTASGAGPARPTTTPTCASTSAGCWPRRDTRSRRSPTGRRRWQAARERAPDLVLVGRHDAAAGRLRAAQGVARRPADRDGAGDPALGPRGRGSAGRGAGGRSRRLPGRSRSRPASSSPPSARTCGSPASGTTPRPHSGTPTGWRRSAGWPAGSPTRRTTR